MADRKVKYVLEVDYEGGGVTARAADDLREVDEAARQSAEGMEQAAGGFSKMQAAVVTAQAAWGLAQQGLEMVAQAAEFAYETLSEGAALEQQQGQFENLAMSIGTTADALMNDLGPALQGLQSNAQMVEGSGQLISLGLANTHEEVVALSEVAGQLDWDMQVLGLTIANMSTARLDALGLSISSVKAKMEEFTAQGMSTEEAFKWAVIEAGRDKIEVLGSAADTSAGQLKILENVAANVQDEFARGGAEGFAEALGVIAGSAPAAGAAMEQASRGVGSFVGQLAGLALMSQFSDDLAYFIRQGQEMEAEMEEQARAMREVEQARADLAEMEAIHTEQAEEGKWVIEGGVTELWRYREALEAVGEEMSSGKAERWAELISKSGDGFADLTAAAGELAQYQAEMATAQAEWAAYTAEATARGGDYFSQIISSGDAQWDFAAAIYAAADAAGAGIGPLGDLAVQYGLIDENVRDAATVAAQQQAIIDSLAGAAAEGQITWENYAGAVERAIEVLNGAYAVDLGPREMPEMEDRGFREGFQENLEQVAAEMEPIPLEVQLEREAIEAAVAEAKGIVEGFTNPPEAYEATATLDISDVESKVGTAKSLIDGLPEEKRINITVTASGMEILEQLRALGAIP